jgi:hypothetical protein
VKASATVPILLLLSGVHASTQAQIYKCKEAIGSLLYTDTPCDADAETIAIMPKGRIGFEPAPLSDAAVEAELRLLSEQEDELISELEAAQAASPKSPQEMTEASALTMQIQALLESVRGQKIKLLGRGVAPEEGEELVVESKQ